MGGWKRQATVLFIVLGSLSVAGGGFVWVIQQGEKANPAINYFFLLVTAVASVAAVVSAIATVHQRQGAEEAARDARDAELRSRVALARHDLPLVQCLVVREVDEQDTWTWYLYLNARPKPGSYEMIDAHDVRIEFQASWPAINVGILSLYSHRRYKLDIDAAVRAKDLADVLPRFDVSFNDDRGLGIRWDSTYTATRTVIEHRRGASGLCMPIHPDAVGGRHVIHGDIPVFEPTTPVPSDAT